MGGCCSCCEDGSGAVSETEMREHKAKTEKSLAVSRAMSSPSIDVGSGGKVSGYGLVLAGVTIEQDAAYWEAHVEVDGEEVSQNAMFGVATKKDKQFYRALEAAQGEDDSPEAKGTALMRTITVKHGDVVGIAVQQSDLPMVQFSLNGEPLHDTAVNRFRGTVYPALYLPENDGLSIRLVFEESQFEQMSPHARFGPVIIARGII